MSTPTSASHRRSRKEMRATLDAGPDELAFRGPTINLFWGHRMEHGGWVRDDASSGWFAATARSSPAVCTSGTDVPP